MSSSPSTSSTRGDNVSLPLQRFHFSVVHSGNVFVRYAAENTSKSFLRSPKPPEAKLRHCELVNDNGNYSLRVLKVKSGEKKVPFFNIDISSSTVITRNDKENEYGFNFQNDDTAEFYLMDATSRDVWVHQLNDCVDILNTPINSTNNSIGNSGNSPEASLVERKSSLAEPELARPAMLGRGNSKKQLSLIQVGDTSEPPMANIRRKVDSPKTTDQRKYINDSRTDSPVHIQTSLTSSPSVGNFSPGMETPGTGRTLRSANSQFGYSKVFEMEDLQFADDNEYRTSSGQLLPPEKQGMPSIDSPLSGERRLRPMNSQFGYSKVFGADDFQFEDDNDFRTSSGTLMSSAEKQATSVALAKHYSSKLSFSQVFDPDENPFGIVNPKLETDDDDDEPKLLSQQLMSLAASPMGQPFLASDSIENVEPYSEEHLDFERVPSSPTLSQTPLVDKRVEAVKAQEPTGKSPTGKSPKNKPPDPKGHGAIGSFRESPVKRLASKHNRSMKMQSMMPTLAEEGDHTTSSNDATGYTHSDQPLTIEAPMTPMTSVASTVEAGVADPSILQQQVQALILMNNHLNQALEKTEANRKTREESLQKQLKEAQEKLRNAVGKKEEAVARVAEKGAQGGKYNNTQLRLDSALLNNVALEEKVKNLEKQLNEGRGKKDSKTKSDSSADELQQLKQKIAKKDLELSEKESVICQMKLDMEQLEDKMRQTKTVQTDIEDSAGKIQDLQREISKLNKALTASRASEKTNKLSIARLESLEQERQAFVEELTQQLASASETKRQLTDSGSRMQTAEEEAARLRAMAERLEQDRTELTLKLEEKSELMAERDQKHKEEVEKLSGKVKGLQKQLKESAKENEQLSSDVSDLNREVENLKSERESLEERVDQANKRADQLRTEGEKQVSNTLQHKEQEILSLQSSLDKAQLKVRELQSQARVIDDEHADEISLLKNTMEKLHTTISELRSALKDAENQLRLADEHAQKQSASLSAEKAAHAKLRDQQSTSDQQNRVVVEDLVQQLREATASKTTLQQALKDARQQIQDSEEEHRRSVEQSGVACRELKANLTSLENSYRDLQTEMEELRSQFHEERVGLETQCENLSKQREHSESRVQDFQRQLSTADQRIKTLENSLANEAAQYRQNVYKLEEGINDLERHNSDLSSRCQLTEEQSQKLLLSLSAEKQALANLQKAYQTLERNSHSELDMLENQVRELQSSLKATEQTLEETRQQSQERDRANKEEKEKSNEAHKELTSKLIVAENTIAQLKTDLECFTSERTAERHALEQRINGMVEILTERDRAVSGLERQVGSMATERRIEGQHFSAREMELQSVISKLTAQLETQEQVLEMERESNAKHTRLIEDIQARVNEKIEEHVKLSSAFEGEKRKTAGLTSELQRLSAAAQEEREDALKNYEALQRHRQEESEAHRAQVQALEVKLVSLENTVVDLKHKLRMNEETVMKLEAKCVEQKEYIAHLEATRNGFEKKHREMHDQLETGHHLQQETNEQLSKEKQTKEALQQRCVEVEAQLSDSNRQLNETKMRLSAASRELQEMHHEKEQHMARIDVLSRQGAEGQLHQDELTTDNSRLRHELASALLRLEEVTKKAESLDDSVKYLRNEKVVELTDTISALERTNRETREKFTHERDALRLSLQAKDSENTGYRARIEILEQSESALRHKVEEVSLKIRDMVNVHDSNHRINQLRDLLTAQIEQLTESKDALTSEREEMNRELSFILHEARRQSTKVKSVLGSIAVYSETAVSASVGVNLLTEQTNPHPDDNKKGDGADALSSMPGWRAEVVELSANVSSLEIGVESLLHDYQTLRASALQQWSVLQAEVDATDGDKTEESKGGPVISTSISASDWYWSTSPQREAGAKKDHPELAKSTAVRKVADLSLSEMVYSNEMLLTRLIHREKSRAQMLARKLDSAETALRALQDGTVRDQQVRIAAFEEQVRGLKHSRHTSDQVHAEEIARMQHELSSCLAELDQQQQEHSKNISALHKANEDKWHRQQAQLNNQMEDKMEQERARSRKLMMEQETKLNHVQSTLLSEVDQLKGKNAWLQEQLEDLERKYHMKTQELASATLRLESAHEEVTEKSNQLETCLSLLEKAEAKAGKEARQRLDAERVLRRFQPLSSSTEPTVVTNGHRSSDDHLSTRKAYYHKLHSKPSALQTAAATVAVATVSGTDKNGRPLHRDDLYSSKHSKELPSHKQSLSARTSPTHDFRHDIRKTSPSRALRVDDRDNSLLMRKVLDRAAEGSPAAKLASGRSSRKDGGSSKYRSGSRSGSRRHQRKEFSSDSEELEVPRYSLSSTGPLNGSERSHRAHHTVSRIDEAIRAKGWNPSGSN